MKVGYDKNSSAGASDGDPTTVTTKEARQGPLGKPVVVILGISMLLAVVAGFLSFYLGVFK